MDIDVETGGVWRPRGTPILPGPPWVEVAPRVFQVRISDSSANVHGCAGFLIAPVSRLLVRVDFYAAWSHVLPDAG